MSNMMDESAKRIIQRIVDANVGMDFTCPADEEEAEQIVSEEIQRLKLELDVAKADADVYRTALKVADTALRIYAEDGKMSERVLRETQRVTQTALKGNDGRVFLSEYPTIDELRAREANGNG